jgi:hypothetical protein
LTSNINGAFKLWKRYVLINLLVRVTTFRTGVTVVLEYPTSTTTAEETPSKNVVANVMGTNETD